MQDAKKSPKIRHLHTIAQLCQTISSQLWHVLTIGKKLVKQQYLLHMSLQYGALWLTNVQDLLASLGHPSKFQQLSRLGFVTAPTSLNKGQPNFAQCLAVSCTVYYICIFGGSCPLTELCQLKNSLCAQLLRSPKLAPLLYSTRALSSAKVYSVVQRMELRNFQRAPPTFDRAIIGLGIGLHSSFNFNTPFVTYCKNSDITVMHEHFIKFTDMFLY